MKVFESNTSNVFKAGDKSKGRPGTSKSLVQIFKMVTQNSLEVIEFKSSDLIRLQEIKDLGKELKGNPWNLVLKSGHANAKVRHWCLRLVSSGVRVEVNGKMEVQHLDAFEFGDGVVFANLQAVRHRIAGEKNTKLKAKMEDRLSAITKLPRRESYY